jgi:signal transduction histidine kinase
MRLRLRFTLVLLLVNAVVLGGLAWWASTDESAREKRRQSLAEVTERLSNRFEQEETKGLRDILDWEGWRDFDEALLVDNRVLELDGNVVPVGAFLNPKGSRHRKPTFPLAEMTKAINLANRSLKPVTVAGGVAMPLVVHEKYSSGPREIWGGVFLRPKAYQPPLSVPAVVGFAALLATAVSAALIYVFLGRAVLNPVERLAHAVESFGEGSSPQLSGVGHVPEIQSLFVSFSDMVKRIQGFQAELEGEVAAATHAAATAERRASRQERLAAMGTLAAGLAHEINSPLAGALHGLETLRAEAKSERATQHGELTAEALCRIQELVQRLLRLAPVRPEAGFCELKNIFADVQVFLATRLDDHPLSIQLEPFDLTVAAAPADLFPVILNLVQNACDSMDAAPELLSKNEKGMVSILARPVGETRVEIEVRDQGSGIDEELLPHLFEPFVTTKDVGMGTGLGLALAHATVRQLGGKVEARNIQPHGFAITLELPIGHPK